MDYSDELKILTDKILKYKDQVTTEEATKMAFIVPFFDLLGYDTRNPFEFVPEFTADIGIKKGEKVDYAIVIDGQPQILIEAKHITENLENHDNQLVRYFHATKAKIGILTNGIIYKFYTDLEEQNKMDAKPFLEINMLSLKENEILELKKFFKTNFDINNILSSAETLKYSNSIRKLLKEEFESPSDEFTTFILSKVYDGVKTQTIKDKFKPIVKDSISVFMNDLVRNKLEGALASSGTSQISPIEPAEQDLDEDRIVTTEEEMQSYYMTKAILAEIGISERITYKDTVRYFNITLDNNIRKWICRFYLNTSNKYISFPDLKNKGNEKKILIDKIDDVYKFKTELFNIINELEPKNN